MAEKNIRFKDANGNYLYPRAKVGNIIDVNGNVVDFSLFAKKSDLTPLATQEQLNQIVTFSVSVVESLPATNAASQKVLYLVPSSEDEGSNNEYIEYLFIKDATRPNGAFEKIGTTKIDLADYATLGNLTAEIGSLTQTGGVIDTRISTYAYSKDEIDGKISVINQAIGQAQSDANRITYEEVQ